ncbi:hypothetical protein M433DRAFT_216442 [Acidomyces richmondensis BFW]|nr:MAG: hypothetical protein FE78DRAFT_367262 [Acidomyces sp. 'richmondensis']KYG46185.1 hypothetical protein M433DRAFT_216442 [Acidomyces richmondensis BFW]
MGKVGVETLALRKFVSRSFRFLTVTHIPVVLAHYGGMLGPSLLSTRNDCVARALPYQSPSTRARRRSTAGMERVLVHEQFRFMVFDNKVGEDEARSGSIAGSRLVFLPLTMGGYLDRQRVCTESVASSKHNRYDPDPRSSRNTSRSVPSQSQLIFSLFPLGLLTSLAVRLCFVGKTHVKSAANVSQTGGKFSLGAEYSAVAPSPDAERVSRTKSRVGTKGSSNARDIRGPIVLNGQQRPKIIRMRGERNNASACVH